METPLMKNESPFGSNPIPVPPAPIAVPGKVIASDNNPEPKFEETQFGKDFLGELRDFMNEFAETELNVNSSEEPSEMSDAKANYYVKAYTNLLQEETEMNELCDSEIDRNTRAINKFRELRQVELDKKKAYLESILKDYAATKLADKRTKTYKLPYGNLSFKKQQPKINYGDESELKAFVKDIKPELIKSEIVEKLDKSLLKKEGEIKKDGFYLNGVKLDTITVQEQDDKFVIK